MSEVTGYCCCVVVHLTVTVGVRCCCRFPEGSDSAYIIGHYAVQQLYCVKNKEGEIIEVSLPLSPLLSR